MNRSFAVCLLALSTFASAAFAAGHPAAPAGTPPAIGAQGFVADTSFATTGSAIVDFNDPDAVWSEPMRTLAAADGSYWMLGFVRPNSGFDQLAISHLLADGSADAGYASNGQRIVPIVATQIEDIAMDAAGNVYVAAAVSGNGADFSVECFAGDGTPCAGFGLDGQTLIPFDQGGPNDDIPRRILIHDDAIYVLGDITTPADSGWDVALGVAKLDLASGELDASFGNVAGLGGRSVFDIDLVPDGADYSADLAFSADGSRLLLTGSSLASDPSTGTALQYAVVLGVDPAAGTLDATFADAGMRVVPFEVGEFIGQFIGKDVTVLHNGRIVFIGDYWHDVNGMVNPEIALIELMPDGSLAADFGTDGIATNLPGYTIETLAVTERPGAGDLVVTTQADGLFPADPSDHQQALVEFTRNGRGVRSEIEITFPSNGINTGPRSRPAGVLVDDQNRSLMWGWRNWEFQTQPQLILNRDITLSRFIDTDAIFGNGFGGVYAD